jgi:hypothetical protein
MLQALRSNLALSSQLQALCSWLQAFSTKQTTLSTIALGISSHARNDRKDEKYMFCHSNMTYFLTKYF